MADVREYDVEVAFVDRRVGGEREALREYGDDGGVHLCAAVIRNGRVFDEFVRDDGLQILRAKKDVVVFEISIPTS